MTGDQSQARPRGVATAVVFDWALTVQLTTQAIAASSGHLGLARDPAAIAGRVVAALLMLALGEGLRRGKAALRVAEATIVALVTMLGVGSAAALVTGHGDRGLVFSVIIELTFAPWLVWALLRPETAAWFAATGARRPPAPRTSGRWLLVLVALSVVWGVAVAWSQSL